MQKITMIALGATAMSISAIATPASAATFFGGTISVSDSTDYDKNLGSLLKFDASLGSLEKAELSYSYDFNTAITLTAVTTTSGRINSESGVQFRSSDAAINAILNAQVNTTALQFSPTEKLDPAAYDIVGSTTFFAVKPGDNPVVVHSSGSGSNSLTIADQLLPAFIANSGGNSFDISAKTLTGLIVASSGGNVDASQRTAAKSSFSVTYHYTAAVPEPATWMMMLSGFGIIGTGLRRQRRVSQIV